MLHQVKQWWRRQCAAARSRREQDHKQDEVLALLQQPAADANEVAANLARAYVLSLRQQQLRDLRWQRLRRSLVVVLMVSGVAGFWWQALGGPAWLQSLGRQDRAAVIGLQGTIDEALASRVVAALRQAQEDPRTKRVVLYIDSSGGAPAQAERIAEQIQVLRRSRGIAVDAVAGSMMASAAYYVALHADRILAPSTALVGSVGAVVGTWDVSGLLRKFDVRYTAIASGEAKTAMHPLVGHQAQQMRYVQELVDDAGHWFAAAVLQHRGSKLRVENFASGQLWLGMKAAQLGLIDRIGTLEQLRSEYPQLKFVSLTSTPPSWLPTLGALAQQWLGASNPAAVELVF
ncbi:MAG: S49 family peptidase [Rhodocyclaceae bacterium]|nr:S49 family peptidase [Rhodocyclaceae bacterium]